MNQRTPFNEYPYNQRNGRRTSKTPHGDNKNQLPQEALRNAEKHRPDDPVNSEETLRRNEVGNS